MKSEEILEILTKTQYISEEDKLSFLEKTNGDSVLALDLLIKDEILTDDLIGQSVAENFNIDYFDLNTFMPTREDVLKIPENISKQVRIVFFKETDEEVYISTDDINNIIGVPKFYVTKKIKGSIFGGEKESKTEENLAVELEKIFGKKFKFGFSIGKDIDKALSMYKVELSSRFSYIMNKLDQVAPEIVDEIIKESIDENVSDIHFEPLPRGEEVRLRFRVDGMLQEVGNIPFEYYKNILNLIKVQSQLRSDEHFIPQDGSINFKFGEIKADVRVSIIPTVLGEKIVLRVLPRNVDFVKLEMLGVEQDDLKTIYRSIQKPFGMVIVTGPTGAGKTSTLYALLSKINNVEKNVVTIEDPVEYRLQGVNHIQVNKETDLTFVNGLRSILRQDPDIILVGEIRDSETAQISINAALTGHLLLSTIHSNDAESTLPRLLSMEVDPFLVSSTLDLIISQRLVRKICKTCLYTYKTHKKDLVDKYGDEIFRFFDTEEITLYKGKGCSNCGYTGYLGRIGIFQLIKITQKIRNEILNNPTADVIRDISRSEGAKSLFEDGLRKVEVGKTTLEEVIRVAAIPKINK